MSGTAQDNRSGLRDPGLPSGTARRVAICVVNTIALPLYVMWFGLHESRDLVGEIVYGWRHVRGGF